MACVEIELKSRGITPILNPKKTILGSSEIESPPSQASRAAGLAQLVAEWDVMEDRNEVSVEAHQYHDVARRRAGVAALAVVCCGAVLIVGLSDPMSRVRGEVGRASLEQLLQAPSSARGAQLLPLAVRMGAQPREEELLARSSSGSSAQLKEDSAAAAASKPKCMTPQVCNSDKHLKNRWKELFCPSAFVVGSKCHRLRALADSFLVKRSVLRGERRFRQRWTR